MSMFQNNQMSFPDVMTILYNIWESSQTEKQSLETEIKDHKFKIDTLTIEHTELLKQFEVIKQLNDKLNVEVDQLKRKIKDAEDDQQEFRKVSRIITMDRENNHYKQQIAILERRVAFYQKQCNNIKNNDILKEDQQTDTDDLLINNSIKDNEQSTTNVLPDATGNIEINENKESDIITYNDDFINNKENDVITYDDKNVDEGISVKEKKIKGIVYYISEENDIYIKNDDSSIGELKGKLEYLPSGKTKVKWYKL